VNLDEVLPHAGGKPLPALQITTRPMSAPPGALSSGPNGSVSSRQGSRTGSPAPKGVVSQLGLGPRPQLEQNKIDDLLGRNYGT
jgi:hypothetical protein